MDGRVFYVGSEREVAHQAQPLQPFLNIELIEPDKVVQAARPGDVAVFFSEHFDRFRTACLALKQRQIPTLYAVDGILEWRNAWENRIDEIACPWTMRPCLSHVVATIGPRQTEILRSWGNSPCVPVGLPRLDELCQRYRVEREESTVSPVSGSKGTNEITVGAARSPATFRILVLTAKCPGFTDEQLETTYRSLVAVRDYVVQSPWIDGRKVEVIWRLTGGLNERLGIDVNALNPLTAPEVSLAERLLEVDAVIATPSTAQLEAMLLGRPVALLDFHNKPVYADAVFRISASEQVGPVLQQLSKFRTSPAHRQMQDYLLRENLLIDGLATRRLVDLIRWLQTRSAAAILTGGPLELNLPQFMSQLPDDEPRPNEIFWQLRPMRLGGVSETAPNHNPAVAANEVMTLAQWQAYTEQLERENRRLSQLVTEAQQVFENLHGHPVWGTLLKSHELWNRWWQGGSGKLTKPESWKEP